MSEQYYPDEEKPMAYRFDLDTQLETVIQEYEDDRNLHWQNKDEVDQASIGIVYAQIEAFAHGIMTAAEDLITGDAVPDESSEVAEERRRFLHTCRKSDDLKDLLEKHGLGGSPASEYLLEVGNRPPEDTALKLIWERLCIRLAWEMPGNIRQGANRLMRLWRLLLDVEPDITTLCYMRRVSRCFLWGFDPECVIMCRGVLDTAFRQAVSDDDCRKKYSNRKNAFEFGLANRIVVAYEESRIIDRGIMKLAFNIKARGDKVVHYELDATKDIIGTIRDTLTVLKAILNRA